MPTPTLRDYQNTWLDGLRDAFRAGFHSPLGVLPTGGGKTVCFSYLAARLSENRKRTVILAHRSELLDQISATLESFGVDHGRIAPGYAYDRRQLVHVASTQTLARRLDRVEVPDYAIPDEAHHFTVESQSGKILGDWRGRNPNLRTVGVTATALRLDGEGLGGNFDTIVIGPSSAALTELGALCPYRLFAPATPVDLSGIGRQAGDFARGATEAAIDKPRITGDAVSHYRKLCDGAPAVAFCVSIAHAEHVAETFRAQGYRSASIDGKMDHGLRAALVADFKRGAINVLTSCDLISEGFDLPGLCSAILLRPTMSLALYLQQVGRALRIAPGKREAIILDHVGNSARHGMPDDDREWSLIGRSGDRKTKAGAAACRQCEKCFAVSPAAALKCRECGEVFPVRPREVEQVDGELSEVEIARARREAMRDQAQADSVEALTELGRRRGMKNPAGWAMHVYTARQAKLQRIADELEARARPGHRAHGVLL